MRLKPRVEALERCNPDRKLWYLNPWHRVIVEPGESFEDVKATYEAEHGPVGDEDNWIIHRIVDPPDSREPAPCA